MAKDDQTAAERAGNNAQDNPRRLRHGELFYMMHELSRLISTYFDQAMASHQLTHAQWWAMMHISEHEGITQSDLAVIMQMGRASAGKLLERLEAKNWILRRPDVTDSRVRRVFLTDRAPAVLDVMAQEGGNLFDDFLAGMSGAEENAMLLAMRKVKANAERHLGIGDKG